MEERIEYPDTLMGEMDAWKGVEGYFEKYGSSADLKDKGFQRMKLKEYDRLWYKYKDQAEHPDNAALLKVILFHRRKLEASLYKGLVGWLRLMAHKAKSEARNRLVGPKVTISYPNVFTEPVPGASKGQDQGWQASQGQEKKPFQGWDYGAKKDQKPGQGLGK